MQLLVFIRLDVYLLCDIQTNFKFNLPRNLLFFNFPVIIDIHGC